MDKLIDEFIKKWRKKLRKEYDHWKIPIVRWNKGNTVYYIDCDCGNLAKRSIREKREFECFNCGRTYVRMFGGNYVEQIKE